MYRQTCQTICEPRSDWAGDRTNDVLRRRPAKSLSWRALRDSIFTAAAVATILACVFGIGPFERPEGSFEAFLSSPASR